jgi:hypothetical protein
MSGVRFALTRSRRIAAQNTSGTMRNRTRRA